MLILAATNLSGVGQAELAVGTFALLAPGSRRCASLRRYVTARGWKNRSWFPGTNCDRVVAELAVRAAERAEMALEGAGGMELDAEALTTFVTMPLATF